MFNSRKNGFEFYILFILNKIYFIYFERMTLFQSHFEHFDNEKLNNCELVMDFDKNFIMIKKNCFLESSEQVQKKVIFFSLDMEKISNFFKA